MQGSCGITQNIYMSRRCGRLKIHSIATAFTFIPIPIPSPSKEQLGELRYIGVMRCGIVRLRGSGRCGGGVG